MSKSLAIEVGLYRNSDVMIFLHEIDSFRICVWLCTKQVYIRWYITDSGSFGLCCELSFVTQMANNHKHKIQSDSRKKGRIQ